MEILMVTGLLAYIMNYIIGKNKNSRLAQAWFTSHKELLESNFALVGESLRTTASPWLLWRSESWFHRQWFVFPGDDGTSKEAVSTGKLNQENEHIYNLWCSGRVCCEGMLIQLKVRSLDVTWRFVLNTQHQSINQRVCPHSFWRGRTCSTCWPGWWDLPAIKW